MYKKKAKRRTGFRAHSAQLATRVTKYEEKQIDILKGDTTTCEWIRVAIRQRLQNEIERLNFMAEYEERHKLNDIRKAELEL